MTTSVVVGTAVVLVVVALIAAGACVWFMVQRARQRSREITAPAVEITAQIVEIHARITENHLENHRKIHAVNERLDHTEAKFVENHRTIHAVNKRLDHTEAKFVEIHHTIHAVNKRLDHLARIEQLARIDRAASAVHQAASEGRLPAVARKKLLAHLDEVRDELSASEPRA